MIIKMLSIVIEIISENLCYPGSHLCQPDIGLALRIYDIMIQHHLAHN